MVNIWCHVDVIGWMGWANEPKLVASPILCPVRLWKPWYMSNIFGWNFNSFIDSWYNNNFLGCPWQRSSKILFILMYLDWCLNQVEWVLWMRKFALNILHHTWIRGLCRWGSTYGCWNGINYKLLILRCQNEAILFPIRIKNISYRDKCISRWKFLVHLTFSSISCALCYTFMLSLN